MYAKVPRPQPNCHPQNPTPILRHRESSHQKTERNLQHRWSDEKRRSVPRTEWVQGSRPFLRDLLESKVDFFAPCCCSSRPASEDVVHP